MTPIWVTIVVAVCTAVLSLTGALGAQLLASSRAYRLATMERDDRRTDRDREDRKETFARFLVAARAFPPPQSADPAAILTALSAIKDAAAYVELDAPLIADRRMPTVLAAATRLYTLLTTHGPSGAAVDEARQEYLAAVHDLRDDLRGALAR